VSTRVADKTIHAGTIGVVVPEKLEVEHLVKIEWQRCRLCGSHFMPGEMLTVMGDFDGNFWVHLDDLESEEDE